MSDEIRDRESALEQQYQELLDQTKRKLQAHEVTIQRLTSTVADKEQQLQVILNTLDRNINYLCVCNNFFLSFGKSSIKYIHIIDFLYCFSLCSSGVYKHGQRL